MTAGLTQPRNGGPQYTSTFLFKVLISVLSIVVAAGVLAMFNMSHLLVRLDERLLSVDQRLVKIETHQERQLESFLRNGTTKRF